MTHAGKTSVRWFVNALVGTFAFVSYLEQMNISIAAASMMPELSLTATQMGQIFSSFLWGYAISLASGALLALACTGAWIVMGKIGFGTSVPEYREPSGDAASSAGG
jgi:sugar phosphate permease